MTDHRSTLRSGDLLLFMSCNPTGFFLKTFTSSLWNHVGIAIRLKKEKDGQYKISLDHEGELFILETNTGKRIDIVTGKDVVGAGFSSDEWVFKKYNKISVRRLKEVFRTELFIELNQEFINIHRGIEFPEDFIPFLSVWLGVPLKSKNDDDLQSGMFCSELTTKYYKHCVGKQYQNITGCLFDGDLKKLFGEESPISEELFAPKHYTYNITPNASFFEGPEEEIYTSNSDLLFTILQPLILVLFFVIILIMILPKKKN